MCVYCMIGDHHFRFDPPFPTDHPLIPKPVVPGPYTPWPVDRLREFEDLLRRVHELEEKLGCPCEPNKADYLTLLRKRIEALEKQAEKRP